MTLESFEGAWSIHFGPFAQCQIHCCHVASIVAVIILFLPVKQLAVTQSFLFHLQCTVLVVAVVPPCHLIAWYTDERSMEVTVGIDRG